MDGDYMDKRRAADFESTGRHKTIVFCQKLFKSEHVPSQPILQTDTTHTVLVTSPGLRQYRSY